MEVQIKVICINEAPNDADIGAQKPKDANRHWQWRQTMPQRFFDHLKLCQNDASLGGISMNTYITDVTAKV